MLILGKRCGALEGSGDSCLLLGVAGTTATWWGVVMNGRISG